MIIILRFIKQLSVLALIIVGTGLLAFIRIGPGRCCSRSDHFIIFVFVGVFVIRIENCSRIIDITGIAGSRISLEAGFIGLVMRTAVRIRGTHIVQLHFAAVIIGSINCFLVDNISTVSSFAQGYRYK